MAENVETQSQPLFDEQPEEEETFSFEEFQQQQQKRKRPRTLLTILIILLVIILAAGGWLYWRSTRRASISYTQAYVTTGNIVQQISATGPVQAKATYNLNFTTSGQVNQINVKVGDQVKAGQTLATITPTNSQQNSSSQTTLTAPANATVAAINGYVGTSVGSGNSNSNGSGNASGSNAFIVLTDTSSLQIVAQVNESDIGNVKVGQPAQFTVAAYPNNTFQATVASINIIGQSSSGVVTYPVTLNVTMSSLNNIHLLPLMTATTNITTQQQNNVLRVPSAALTFSTTALQNGYLNRAALRNLRNGAAGQQGNTDANQQGTTGSSSSTTGKRGIVLELQNGVLTPVMVTTGLSDGQYTQIISGLNEGDQVVTNATGGNATQNTTTGQQRNGGFGGGGGGFGGGGFRNGGGGGNGGGRGQ
ncbi:efflux RND transporter periplasmic adaptor subunit [Dictyobacter aurantiacus]|uniref:RND transporter n=1 Tax=Dictyobacter aurantiacus TaxID=1936993 RepID=A0A401ZF84_9CHLR|nr:efflux RND transporter periplasmic adaptor subunit [Dictyobacter aurantiacus]GCE05506.1 hypothetical protein KDAU_28350 [Dictyobacter aurantiacus]